MSINAFREFDFRDEIEIMSLDYQMKQKKNPEQCFYNDFIPNKFQNEKEEERKKYI